MKLGGVWITAILDPEDLTEARHSTENEVVANDKIL